jgi:hypothetical protein
MNVLTVRDGTDGVVEPMATPITFSEADINAPRREQTSPVCRSPLKSMAFYSNLDVFYLAGGLAGTNLESSASASSQHHISRIGRSATRRRGRPSRCPRPEAELGDSSARQTLPARRTLAF